MTALLITGRRKPMPIDPTSTAVQYLAVQVRARFARARTGAPDAGALSLEWVAIAIVLVVAALALATFLTGKLHDLEKLIPN
jgi:hypothetical protein